MADDTNDWRPTVTEQAYLLAIRTWPPAQAVTAAAVGRRMGVTTQAAGEMLRRLVASGIVEQDEHRHIHLTTIGMQHADSAYRRHALAEWLLISVLGLGWAEADEEAMRLQAGISPRVEAALADLFGHPETCPHGNPIEDAVARRRPAGRPLSELESGDRAIIYRVTEDAEADPQLLSYLEARRLMPGAQVRVMARSTATDSLSLDGPLGHVTLGLRPASLIRVLPPDADPALFHKAPPWRR